MPHPASYGNTLTYLTAPHPLGAIIGTRVEMPARPITHIWAAKGTMASAQQTMSNRPSSTAFDIS